jgi:hypothetical protein
MLTTAKPQRGAEETQNKGQQAADAAKEKTQGRPGDNLKSTVEDKTQNLREEGERFMKGGNYK